MWQSLDGVSQNNTISFNQFTCEKPQCCDFTADSYSIVLVDGGVFGSTLPVECCQSEGELLSYKIKATRVGKFVFKMRAVEATRGYFAESEPIKVIISEYQETLVNFEPKF